MKSVTPVVRVVVIILAALAIVGLIAFSRGHVHHHGWDQVGRHALPLAPSRHE